MSPGHQVVRPSGHDVVSVVTPLSSYIGPRLAPRRRVHAESGRPACGGGRPVDGERR